jgi:hypothetical protein
MTSLSAHRMAGLDQRAPEWFPVSPGTTCTTAVSVVEEPGAFRVLDVSIDGVGLRVARRVEPGALLAVGLSNPAKGLAKTVLVRVARVTPDGGGWLVAGTFLTPLTYQELTSLVL